MAAGFAEGGAADVLAPGAELAGLVTAVTGPDGTRLGTLTRPADTGARKEKALRKASVRARQEDSGPWTGNRPGLTRPSPRSASDSNAGCPRLMGYVSPADLST